MPEGADDEAGDGPGLHACREASPAERRLDGLVERHARLRVEHGRIPDLDVADPIARRVDHELVAISARVPRRSASPRASRRSARGSPRGCRASRTIMYSRSASTLCAGSVTSRSRPRSISVSGRTEPSRWQCSSAFGRRAEQLAMRFRPLPIPRHAAHRRPRARGRAGRSSRRARASGIDRQPAIVGDHARALDATSRAAGSLQSRTASSAVDSVGNVDFGRVHEHGMMRVIACDMMIGGVQGGDGGRRHDATSCDESSRRAECALRRSTSAMSRSRISRGARVDHGRALEHRVASTARRR